jgi:hypothetical protein
VAAFPAGRVPGIRSLGRASLALDRAGLCLDLRAARRLGAGLGICLVGKDLLEGRHAELEHSHDPRVVVQIRRSAYVQLTWRR